MELTNNLAGLKGGKVILCAFFLILCILFSLIILSDPDTAMVLSLAMVGGFLIVRQPVIGILIILVTTSTITNPQVYPKLSVAGADIEFTEVMIILTLCLLFIKNGVASSLRYCFSLRITLPLIAFFVWVVVSVIYCLYIYPDLELTVILARSRNIIYYMLFFPTLLTLRNEKDLQLFVRGLLILTALVSFYFIFTAVFGQTYLHYILRTGIRFGITGVDTGDVSDLIMRDARLRDVPGTSLVVSMFFVAIALFIYHYSTKGAIWYGSLSALFTIPILLTFTRMTWATIIFVSLILLFLVRKKTFRITKLAIIMGSGFLVVFLALALHPKYSNIISLTTDRLRSFFEENIETSTALYRIIEMKAAMKEIEENPIMGIGIAGEIERQRVDYRGKEYILADYSGTHNSYFNMALKIGIPGLAIFLLIYLKSLFGAFRTFRKSDNLLIKGLAIGLFLSLLRTLLNGISQQYFMAVSMVPCLAISFALIETLRKMSETGSGDLKPTGRNLTVKPSSYPDRVA